jgi:hypothetical protein
LILVQVNPSVCVKNTLTKKSDVCGLIVIVGAKIGKRLIDIEHDHFDRACL